MMTRLPFEEQLPLTLDSAAVAAAIEAETACRMQYLGANMAAPSHFPPPPPPSLPSLQVPLAALPVTPAVSVTSQVLTPELMARWRVKIELEVEVLVAAGGGDPSLRPVLSTTLWTQRLQRGDETHQAGAMQQGCTPRGPEPNATTMAVDMKTRTLERV